MKRSWLQIVCIVVAGLASTTGCGNKTPQTADATGAQATGPAPGQYSPPPSSGSGAPGGDSGGSSDEATTESASPSGSPSAGAPSGAPSMGGIGMAGPSAYGSPSPGSPSPGSPSMGGISMAGPGAYGGSSGDPSGGRPSLGTSGAGAGSPYGDGYGAAAGYSGGAPGSMGSNGPGAPGLGMSGAPGMNGYGYPGGNAPNMGGGTTNAGNAAMPVAAKPAPPKKLTFEERSKIAFQSGNTNRAYDLAYAHSLMSPDSDAMKVASAYRVAPTKSSPALGIQVAVGLSVVKPDGLTDLKPIGTDWQSITGGGGSGMGPGSAGMGAPGMDGFGMPGYGGAQGNSTSGSKALTDAAGSLATSFIDSFKEEHSEGKWSMYFKDEEYKGRAAAAGQSGMGDMGGMAGGFPGYGGAPGGMLGGGMAGAGALGVPGASGVQGGVQGGAQGGSGGSGASGGVVQFRRSGGILPGFEPESGMFGGEAPQDRPSMSGLGGGGTPGAGNGSADDSAGLDTPAAAGPGGVGHGAGGPSGLAPGGMGPGGMVPGGIGLGGGAAGGFAGEGGFGSAPGMGGYGGPAGMGGPAGGMGGQSVGGGVVRPTIDPADVKIEQGIVPLGPCLHYIGSGEPKSLIENAFEKGYDVLVIFEVEVTQNRRNNVVTNTALIRCVVPGDSPKNVENIVKSKSLVNRDVAQAKRKNEDDGVDDVIKSVLRRMGEKVSLQPIPEKLTPDYVVSKRLPAILSNEKLSKLCKLSEVNFYYQKGFLDEAQRADFYERIAGDLAEDVLSEDLEQRESAILELLNS